MPPEPDDVHRMNDVQYASLINQETGHHVDPIDSTDLAVIVSCGSIYGLTTLVLAYAWCNYKYRPIRAKNLGLVTLLHVCSALWFVGNIPTNGHVRLVGAWSLCKLWMVWFRMLFCYLFATVLILRFYAVDRVFNQNKPFRGWHKTISWIVTFIFAIICCLVIQLVDSDITVKHIDHLELCDITYALEATSIAIQWALWAGVAVLVWRLRNIQNSFNEFRENLAILIAAMATLIDATVVKMSFKYYSFNQDRRIERTLVDTLGTTVIIWLIIAYPVFMCLFYRRHYEATWLEQLSKDGHHAAYQVGSVNGNLNCNNNKRNSASSYTRMDDESHFQQTQIDFGDTDPPSSAYFGVEKLATESTYYDLGDNNNSNNNNIHVRRYDQNPDPISMAINNSIRMHPHQPGVASTANIYMGGVYLDPPEEGRQVL